MSFPYVMDISFGSEMSAVGGNLPSKIVSGGSTDSGESTGPGRIEGEVFTSNMVTVYRFISSSENDDPKPEALKVYYRVDLTDIPEGEDRDTFVGILRNLHVTIKQGILTGGTWKPFNNDSNHSTSNLADLVDNPEQWSIILESNSNFMITGPAGSVTTSLLSKDSMDPVTDPIYYSDDLNKDYEPNVTTEIIMERSFTFGDK